MINVMQSQGNERDRRRSGQDGRRGWGLAAISLGFLMITLDATIVNVALGPIVADVGGSLSAAQWIVNGYTLAFAALLLSAGSLADRLGSRAGFLAGLGAFVVGSPACAAAPTLTVLIVSRIVQGSGAALLMPCSLALISHTFPPGNSRRRALSVWGGASGVGLAAGPVLGGIMVAAVGWRAIFIVNVPIGLITGLLLARHVAETDRHQRAIDVAGQVLTVAALGALTAGFILAGSHGWGSAPAILLLGSGVLAAAGFVIVQRGVAEPMIPGVLFARPTFAMAVAIGALFNFCLYGSLFCLALYLHDSRGLTPLLTGLAMLPMTLTVGIGAALAGRLIGRIGEWPVITVGLSSGLAGATLIAIAAHAAIGVLILATLPLGAVSLAMPAMTAEAMADAPHNRVGLASGVLNASRQAGGALGVAVLGTLLASSHGLSLPAAFAVVAAAYASGLAVARAGHRHSRGNLRDTPLTNAEQSNTSHRRTAGTLPPPPISRTGRDSAAIANDPPPRPDATRASNPEQHQQVRQPTTGGTT